MIKWGFISLFVGLMLIKPITQFSWECWYLANYDFVAEELCENKDEPALECNGKCYLAKQIAKTEVEKDSSNEDQPVPPFQVKEENICSSSTVAINIVLELFEDQKDDFSVLKTPAIQSYIEDIFHPPQA